MYYKQRLTAQTAAHTWGYSLQNFYTLALANEKKNKTAEIFFKNLQKHCSTRQNVNALLSLFLLSLIHLHEIIAGWGKFSTPTCQFPMAPS